MNKFLSYIAAPALLAAASGLAGCQAQMDTPDFKEPVAKNIPNTTISDLKRMATETPEEIFVPVGDRLSQRVGTLADGSDIIIRGRVISSDASGNIYKQIVIQDETAALTFSVNQRCMFSDYPLGQEVVVNMTGLWLGYYSGLMQVGCEGDPYEGEPQIDRMPWALWLEHTERNGWPLNDFTYIADGAQAPAEQPYYILADLKNLPAAGQEMLDMQGQLVEFRNVYFEEAGKDTYAVYEESANRTLRGVDGGTITVRNSGYSNFYNQMIPEGTGTVRGILSYYQESYQLVLRDVSDVLISTSGTQDEPFSVEQLLDSKNFGLSGWSEGYIVGSVKAGVTTVTSNDDIIFGKDAEMDNNLVIAQEADVTDWTKCAVVELPQATLFRRYGNLADNPAVYKRKLKVEGVIGRFLGMTGVTDNPGSVETFSIDGIEIDPNAPVIPDTPSVEAKGSGTETDPYNIGAVLNATEGKKDVWVVGYVAGYCPDNDWTTAVFGNRAGTTNNYLNAANVILTEGAAASADFTNSCPATLRAGVKPTLGLVNNPSIFGKRVMVKGEITKVYDTWGIKNISEVREL